MLFVTNGDSAANRIRRLGLAREVLPWRDVLHEGPVRSGLSSSELREVRARFIAERGWGVLDEVLDDFARRDSVLGGFRGPEEIVLWFEHNLYDQLQLIQPLDRFEGRDLGTTMLTLVCADEYLGTLAPDRLLILFEDRHDVRLLQRDTTALQFLESAMLRHLEQFPSVQIGLSRSETQLLEAILEGNKVLREAFVSSQEREERLFLGDSVFATYLEGLSATCEPLVLFEDGSASSDAAHPSFAPARIVRRERLAEAAQA